MNSAGASGRAKVRPAGGGEAAGAAAGGAARAGGAGEGITSSTSVVAMLDHDLLHPWFESGDGEAGEGDAEALGRAVERLSLGGDDGAMVARRHASDINLGGRRLDSVWPPPSIPGTLRHVRQSRGWDCGLACVQMVADFCSPAASASKSVGASSSSSHLPENSFKALRDEVGTTSVWTVHLSTLLRARGVAHIYTTTCAGINTDLKSLTFYRSHIDRDQERVLALFDEAHAAGVPIVERSFPVEAWQHAIMTRRVVLILLVDTRALRCVVCGCFKRQWFTCGFAGHYVVVFAYDTEKEAFAYHDPGSDCKVCWMRPVDFDKARSAKGTDEDVIVCAY